MTPQYSLVFHNWSPTPGWNLVWYPGHRKRYKLLDASSCEYSRWGKTDHSKPNIFSCMILAECGTILLRRSTVFFLLTTAGHFLRRFSSSHCSCWDYKSALNVWLQFKDWKWIIPLWFHHTHSMTFHPWRVVLYSLHNGLALLCKYMSTEHQGVNQTNVTQSCVIPLA